MHKATEDALAGSLRRKIVQVKNLAEDVTRATDELRQQREKLDGLFEEIESIQADLAKGGRYDEAGKEIKVDEGGA